MTTWATCPAAVGHTRWSFPPPEDWTASDDIVGFGADLAPATVIAAYRQGIFPMPVEAPDPILAWWSPDPRGILPLDGMRITKSLKQSAKHYEVRVDTAFDAVIRHCANPKRPKGWISPEIMRAYSALHELGWAHSVEAFDKEGQLAGGLYGVRIGRLFAGESMFQLQRDASKVALMGLVSLMRESGMTLLDVQWQTEHLASLGVIEVSRDKYLTMLSDALDAP